MLRDARAIGDTVQVDLPVTQGAAHRIQVAYRDAGGVLPQIGLRRQLRQATINLCWQGLLIDLALQRLRLTGAALVDQDDVAITADARKGRGRAGVKVAGSHTRSARQDKHGVGCTLPVDRGYARHKQAHAAPASVAAVFGDQQIAALAADSL